MTGACKISHNRLRITFIIHFLFINCLLLPNITKAKTPSEIAKEVFPSVVLLVMADENRKPISFGSGFIVKKGVVASNYHVIKDSTLGVVKIIGREDVQAIEGVIASDTEHDLVLLAVPGIQAPPLTLSHNLDLEVGDQVFVVGNPLGLEGTFSDGMVSAIREIKSVKIIQITAPISPGSSGGPVLNSKGMVIGVATESYVAGQNLNIAIASTELKDLMDKHGISALPNDKRKSKNIAPGNEKEGGVESVERIESPQPEKEGGVESVERIESPQPEPEASQVKELTEPDGDSTRSNPPDSQKTEQVKPIETVTQPTEPSRETPELPRYVEEEGESNFFTLHEVEGRFIQADALGLIFVVQGRIRNNNPYPVRSLRVQGLLRSQANKEVLPLFKTVAYAGNRWTDNEINNLTLSQLSRAVNTREGRDRFNEYIAAGGRIPFSLVFTHIPSPSPMYSIRVTEYEAISEIEPKSTSRVEVPKVGPIYWERTKDSKLVNSLGMEFQYVVPGTFRMGSTELEMMRDNDETPHEVTLTHGFYVQTTEVTQGQWREVMGSNPSYFSKCGDDCPVEQVSWIDCRHFIKKLNLLAGSDHYRLPTEAEWEYAARAGSTTPYSFGICVLTEDVNYNGNHPPPGCRRGVYREETVPAASLSPNAWGLYDMHGNVWEWVQDGYGDYRLLSQRDPLGPASGATRVFRGGGWNNRARNCRSANRLYGKEEDRGPHLGLRLVKSISGK